MSYPRDNIGMSAGSKDRPALRFGRSAGPGQTREGNLKVRYFGADDLEVPVSADGKAAIRIVYRGEFNDDDLFLGEHQWMPHLNKWVETRRLSAWWFMGEGWLSSITEDEAMAFIEKHRPRNEAGEVVDGVKLSATVDYLLQLEHDEPWIFDFNFGQWEAFNWDDSIVGFCQVLRVDDNNWWVEFSSDEFNNPKLTDRQRKAILDAGFDEPVEGESPNYWLKMADPTAKQVVALIERVLNSGFLE
jgi:hypothetical protein